MPFFKKGSKKFYALKKSVFRLKTRDMRANLFGFRHINKRMKNKVITALITPMNDAGKIDYSALKKIARTQASAKVDGLLLFGTTGEPLSITLDEKKAIIQTVQEATEGKIGIICGISSPITHDATMLAEFYFKHGADCLMAITPYYYKCTTEGIILHFKNIAESTELPLIVYNVPIRTGIDICENDEVISFINETKRICAVKNAQQTVDDTAAAFKKIRKPVFCGNDCFNLLTMTLGGFGSISVISNFLPELEVKMHNSFDNDNLSLSKRIDADLNKVAQEIFTMPNPIGIKCACAIRYAIPNGMRLPLIKPNSEIIKKIEEAVTYGINKTEELV